MFASATDAQFEPFSKGLTGILNAPGVAAGAPTPA